MDPKVREHQYEQLTGDKRASQDAASTGKLSGRKTFNDGLCLFGHWAELSFFGNNVLGRVDEEGEDMQTI